MSILAIVGIVLGSIMAAVFFIFLGLYLAVSGTVKYVASGEFTDDLTNPKSTKKGDE
jgi:hypothetical protein